MSDDRNRYGNFEDRSRRDGNRDQENFASARDYGAGDRSGRDERNFRGGGTGYGGGDYRSQQGYSRDRDNRISQPGGDRGGSMHDSQRFTEHGGREEYSRTGNWGGNQDWQRAQGGSASSSYDRDRGGSMFGGHADRGQQQRWSSDDTRHRTGGGMFSSGPDRDDYRNQRGGQPGRQPEGYNQDRGFLDRAGDEVRSWFGDSEAERRREFDQRQDEALGGSGGRGGAERDDHYHSWRREQIAQLDRDYDEYRREHGQKFSNEFGTWRGERQTQRDCLNRVHEHMEVLGSDGQHIGTVDKVRGDRILLTKNDVEAGGRHHSIPSRWLQNVDDKVTIRKTLEEAKREWRDEERNSAFFGDDEPAALGAVGAAGVAGAAQTTDTARANATDTARAMRGLHKNPNTDDGEVDLNRSFSGTYDKK